MHQEKLSAQRPKDVKDAFEGRAISGLGREAAAEKRAPFGRCLGYIHKPL